MAANRGSASVVLVGLVAFAYFMGRRHRRDGATAVAVASANAESTSNATVNVAVVMPGGVDARSVSPVVVDQVLDVERVHELDGTAEGVPERVLGASVGAWALPWTPGDSPLPVEARRDGEGQEPHPWPSTSGFGRRVPGVKAGPQAHPEGTRSGLDARGAADTTCAEPVERWVAP